jgi:bifunctional non-homologous end joining protein LigD
MSQRTLPAGFIAPCLPSPAERPPTGPRWIHEIKHDGYRLMARRDPTGVRLLTRNGHDWATRFPLIVEAVNHLTVRSCLIDGEAVCCADNGMAVFAKLRQRRNDRHVFLYAFDLLELDGDDLRREPIERRRVLLIRLLAKAPVVGLQVNDHIVEPGDVVFRHACQLGSKASCRSGWARATLRGARATGSSSRIRRRRRCVARLKKIGGRWREATVDVGGARPGSGTLKRLWR